MTKLPEVELEALAKIAPDALRLLWVNDVHEGRLEAVVEHAGQACLMVLHDEGGAAERPYRWLLVHLTPEQRADEERWHALYVAHVGDHWCFHGSTVVHDAPVGESDPPRFYDAYRERPRLDLSANPVLGWSDEMPAH